MQGAGEKDAAIALEESINAAEEALAAALLKSKIDNRRAGRAGPLRINGSWIPAVSSGTHGMCNTRQL